MLVCTLGDLTLDVVVRLAAPVATGGDTNASIHVGPGGQAANVAAWAAALGVSARFVGTTGADDAGDLVRAKLAALGVEIAGPVGGRNGTICSLVQPDGERSMASDRGAATDLRAEDLEAAWLACDHLHVSGYALMSPIFTMETGVDQSLPVFLPGTVRRCVRGPVSPTRASGRTSAFRARLQ